MTLHIPENLYFHGFECSSYPNPKKQFNTEKIRKTMQLINKYCQHTQTIRKDIGSYSLKHIIEKHFADNYLSNGELIVAMLNCGFDYKKEHVDSPNCYFNVSKKSIRELNDNL
ncbi:MAG: hypothetical protein AAF378_18260 [Cyanobacteria bacterium P01_A01_bin.84]